MGLDKVVKDISEKTEADCKAIAAKASTEAAGIKTAAEAEARQIHAAEMAKAEQAVSRMRQRELSSAKLDIKKSRLNAEKDVLEEVHASFTRQLSALPGDRKADLINKLVTLAKKDIPTGKIFTNAADADLVKGSGYAYGGSIKCIGGILVTSEDGSINLDYTFDSILEDVWTSSMKNISDILFVSR
ncbi:MAG: V-type ATP synthase subunit E [Methanocella sp. PtaU1.Bin125]|nr:MAG: V-type ATP synthase subunit E [Methanocella sp. PtaU1.Bin125]